MARVREFTGNKSGWLITFADLVTLLLALFVLIFSMSSLDSAVTESISSSVSRDRPKKDLFRGKVDENIRELAQLIADTGQIHQHEGRIKELLFPRDLLPPAIDKGTLETNFRVLESGEGVTFVVSGALLFEADSSRISAAGREILNGMAPLLFLLQSDVRITGFYSGPRLESMPDDYAVAARWSLSTLGVFINQGLKPGMFSLSAYSSVNFVADAERAGMGPGWVEILLKTGKKGLIDNSDKHDF